MKPFSPRLAAALARMKPGQGLFMRLAKDGKRYYPGDVGERIETDQYAERYAALFGVLQSAAIRIGPGGPADKA